MGNATPVQSSEHIQCNAYWGRQREKKSIKREGMREEIIRCTVEEQEGLSYRARTVEGSIVFKHSSWKWWNLQCVAYKKKSSSSIVSHIFGFFLFFFKSVMLMLCFFFQYRQFIVNYVTCMFFVDFGKKTVYSLLNSSIVV